MVNEDIRIEPAEAKARVDAGEAVILDVVSASSRERMTRSIANAIRIDPEDIPRRYRKLQAGKQIIAYCT